MFWDLHFHSTNSDGNKTPEERIRQIQTLDPKNQGLWAMTDHDRYTPDFVLGARDAWIRSVWATEISAHSNEIGLSLHITCYTPTLSGAISTMIGWVIEWRKAKVLEQIKKLQSHGFQIDTESFFQWIESEKMSRNSATNWHIAHYIWKNSENRNRATDMTKWLLVSDEWEKNMLRFMRECLRENGDFSHIGYHNVPRYEPELSSLIALAKKEDAILSVAHPNFSFTKKLNKDFWAQSREDRLALFWKKIVPILSELGIKNYEINTLASQEWVQAIIDTTTRTWWLTTYGSDNHGLDDADSKHGVFGVQNPYLTEDLTRRMRTQLHSFI